jgi:choline kinase
MTGPSLLVLAAGRARRFGGIKPLAPVGPNHEAIIDLLVSDAVEAGFSAITVVVNNDSGPLLREHINKVWPAALDVSFAVQSTPRGTVHAVESAREAVDNDVPFAVVNADDLYGTEALSLCSQELVRSSANVLVGYRLRNAIVGAEPVTRGICSVHDAKLTSIVERRAVIAKDGRFESHDGNEPVTLDPDAVVSMNLWGFAPGIWEVFDQAMARADRAIETAGEGAHDEVLLPEVVGALLRGELEAPEEAKSVHVIVTETRCVGVTHPDDLEAVRADLIDQVATGARSETIFAQEDATER